MPLADLLSHARRSPERIALVHNGVAWSYAALVRRVADTSAFLVREGVSPPGVAAVCISRLPDAWVAILALQGLGFTTIAVGSAGEIPPLDLRDLVLLVTMESEPDAVAAGSRCRAMRLPPPPAGGKAEEVPPDATALAGMMSGGHILLTSGTTGYAKKVLRAPQAEPEALSAMADELAFSAASVAYIGDLPLWTAGGYRWPQSVWSRGGTVVLHQWTLPGELPRHLRFTHAFATPATLAGLLQGEQPPLPRDDDMRLVVTAGALPRHLAQLARTRLTRRIFTMYASTEASFVALTAIESDDDLQWHRIVPSRRVEVVDESGRPLAPGEVGEVRVDVRFGVSGYLDDEPATREFFRDGCFHPGDLGMLGADGRLSLQGRATDVINILGNKIASGPIERALQDHLRVEAVCVLSLQDEGDEVHVVIQSRQPVDLAGLESAAGSNALGAFRRVHFHVLDSLPRNDMGKIRRIDLRRQLLARDQPRAP